MSESHLAVALPEGMAAILVDGERVIPQGWWQFLVASKSAEDQHYSVEWNDELMVWTCTCDGFLYRHVCRHVRAISRWAGGKADVRWVAEDDA